MLISIDMSADYITGVFISMLFAGHHTSSGTSAWTLIELMRHPDVMAEVVEELDDLYADGSEISFQALRSIPKLESVIKETLRLHPPLIILMRQVVGGDRAGRAPIPVGTIVASSPRVSNRLEEDFPDAQSFVPSRYLDPRQEDLQNRWTWIPFGAGKHRCVGNAFAMMQIKAIFSVLLQDFEFELVQPSETYRDDYSKMVIQLQRPCRARYRRRPRRPGEGRRRHRPLPGAPDVPGRGAGRLRVRRGRRHRDPARRASRRLRCALRSRPPSATAPPWPCRIEEN